MSVNLVSVIVPCYNQAQYLDECLQSILEQTYSDWECIIVNDGSPDNTKEIAQKWLAKDSRFKYVKKENGGLSSARNYGINIAIGKFILPLDADDRIGSEYLEKSIAVFKKESWTKLVYCKAEKFGAESAVWNLPEFSLDSLGYFNMIFCSALYRKSEWEKVGGYDVNMIYGLEDWEFWIAILKNGGGVKQLDYIGFYYRIKNNSMIRELKAEEKKYLFEYISVKHADFYVKQYGSFMALNKTFQDYKKDCSEGIIGRKKALNLFLKTFFGVSLFKN
ncbi:glycosyltransferase family 2 protein [Flavobacterium anhuiense]|uniref:glycosyltransferase family 2 protein n=1 Tax=Flavobacterium anhuiense TaxID=459526 RepID=UPI003D95CF28